MKSEPKDVAPIIPDANDREAARRALARNWPNLEQTSSKYLALLEALADFHRHFGRDSFELRYNLRPPKDRTEEWTQQFMHGQISATELRARFKADTERPIDLEMLTTFCDAYSANLEHYSAVLQKAVLKPSEEGSSTCRLNEKAIDEHVATLRGKLPLWRENLETVFEFLEELRITSGAGLIRLGDFEATSAHWLAQLAFTKISEAWRSCKEVSARSHTDPRYLYAATPIELFGRVWLSKFPTPQSIAERLREEFVLARAALKSGAMTVSPELVTDTNSGAAMGNLDQAIDNESRELILMGDTFALVGKAGHIFRPIPNSDWGIDGEIEFKDSAGRASGRRLYLQLKSGDSYLMRRKGDGEEIFTVKNRRHLEYWMQQAYPVMLVIRQSNGLIRWMDISAYLKTSGQESCQIVFRGLPFTVETIREYAEGTNKD